MNRLLIIGPFAFDKYPSSIGGASRLFEVLKENIHKNNIDAIVIPINRFQGKPFARVVNLIYIISVMIFKHRRYDTIMINVSQGGILILFPIVSWLSGILKRKLVLRAFGGHLLETINSSKYKKILYKALRKTQLIFVESKELVTRVSAYNSNAVWFPNCRKLIDYKPDFDRQFNYKFVFIGQIKESKGVNTLIEVFNKLPDNYKIDFYGPFADDNLMEFKNDNRYKGVLNPEQVVDVLKNSDVLLLPTWYEGEGYPGVIIEAYNFAIPCITTRWRQVPEIVDHGSSGILIPPKNSSELKNAILSIDQKLWEKLRKGAFGKVNEFDEQLVHSRIFSEMESLV